MEVQRITMKQIDALTDDGASPLTRAIEQACSEINWGEREVAEQVARLASDVALTRTGLHEGLRLNQEYASTAVRADLAIAKRQQGFDALVALIGEEAVLTLTRARSQTR